MGTECEIRGCRTMLKVIVLSAVCTLCWSTVFSSWQVLHKGALNIHEKANEVVLKTICRRMYEKVVEETRECLLCRENVQHTGSVFNH